MQNLEKRNKYEKLNIQNSGDVSTHEKSYNLVATLRALTFLAALAALLIGIMDGVFAAKLIGLCMAVAFVVLLVYHAMVEDRLKKSRSIGKVLERYIARCTEDWRDFEDTGADLIPEGETVAGDADILGKDSLYQLISVCHTQRGRKKLARILCRESDEDRVRRREAVRELTGCEAFAVEYEAAGIRLESEKGINTESPEKYLSEKVNRRLPVWMQVLRFAAPVTEFFGIIAWLSGGISYVWPLVGFFVILILDWLAYARINEITGPLRRICHVMDEYIEMLRLIEASDFEAELLVELKNRVSGEGLKALGRLGVICRLLEVSHNPFLHQLLCGLTLWDYQVAALAVKWRASYGKLMVELVEVIGYMEALLSLSVISGVRNTCMAKLSGEPGVSLEFENMYHPLIPCEKVVANSGSLSAGITIITGSNMSGKTTFMRTIAMNLVLAYAGAPVCADDFRAPVMHIFTSMRVTDDVAHGISTFYAEILRIKEMSEACKKGLTSIFLIDEIFKGTNSADRIYGATRVVAGLARENSMVVVSTHDSQLCDITDEAGKAAVNLHFEEYYKNDEIKFDYKLKNGRCENTNARYLLKMAGFDL